MQKSYETPYAEKIEFDYKEQVVAQSREIGEYYKDYQGNCKCGETSAQ